MTTIRQMRPRSPRNRGLEPNLYAAVKQTKAGPTTYYTYRHPLTGERHAWGAIPRERANRAARVLNNRLLPEADLVGQVMGTAGRTWGFVLDQFEARYPKWSKGWAARTAREHRARIRRYRRDLGNRDFESFPQDELSAYINRFAGDGRTQNRNLLIHIYRFAVAEGYCKHNLAENTLPSPQSERQRRPIKTLEEYQAIYDQAPEWLQCAMELSRITLQARAEIATMRFWDIQDGRLYVVRNKTKDRTERAYIRILISPQLDAVLRRCRRLPVAGPTIIRRRKLRRPRDARPDWARVTVKNISDAFAQARDATGRWNKLPANQRPSFHEIRGFGSRRMQAALLERGYTGDQAREAVNKLLGHTSLAMTDVYLDDGSVRWTDAETGVSD